MCLKLHSPRYRQAPEFQDEHTLRSQGSTELTNKVQTGLGSQRPWVDGAKTARHTARSDDPSPDKGNRGFLWLRAVPEVSLLEALARYSAEEWQGQLPPVIERCGHIPTTPHHHAKMPPGLLGNSMTTCLSQSQLSHPPFALRHMSGSSRPKTQQTEPPGSEGT